MSKKLWTGKTARQELISMAITKMRAYDVKAEWAIESVLDGAKHGTIGGAMYDYYTTLSDFSAGRLIATVQRLGSIE